MIGREARTSVARKHIRGSIVALAVAASCAFAVVTQGFAAPDEAWFLQVVARGLSGDVLYRDVYFNATPLSVYLTMVAAWLFGIELLVVRMVVAIAFVVTLVFCWRVLLMTGAGRLAPWLLVCWWAQPAPYTPVAMAFFSAAFYLAARWTLDATRTSVADRTLAAAAACAAGCFLAKQNLGIYCLAALVTAVVVVDPGAARRRVRTIAVAFGLIAVAGLLPVVLSGGGERLLVYGFIKDVYLDIGAVPYSASLWRFLAAAQGPVSLDTAAAAYREFAFLLPLPVFVLLIARCLLIAGRDRRVAIVVTIFVSAGYLVVFPQPGGSAHLYALPMLVFGLAFGWHGVSERLPRGPAFVITALVSTLFAVQVGMRAARYTSAAVSDGYVTSAIPHFRGIRAPRGEYDALVHESTRLAVMAAGQPIFLVGPNTGFHYLAANLSNPDPFDYPYASTFGRTGQQDVIRRIESGRINSVFLFAAPMGRQTPQTLHDFVKRAMTPGAQETFGALYRKTPSP